MTPFIVVNSIILAFISNKVAANFTDQHANLACFIAGIFGIILIIPWWGTFVRNTAYYHLRMGQAKMNEPNGWNILNTVGENFSKGKKVKIGEDYVIAQK